MLTASCGENKTADSNSPPALSAPQAKNPSAPAPMSNAPKVQSQGQAVTSDAPAPPRDAQFTIVCKVIPGPGHVERAKELKDDLIKGTPLKSWYVTHDEEKSTLFYGYYTKVDDPNLKSDRAKIASMQDQIGNRPFAEALPVAVNQPDPTAPPEFDLANAKGHWSLEIASYQGPGRKEAAVGAVEEARKEGVEAYYHHGPNVSSVCIGAWPEEAVKRQETDGAEGIDPADQKRPLLVLGPGSEMIPESVKDQYAHHLIEKDSGQPVQLLEQKAEIIDPTMRAVIEKYPNHSLNGYEDVTQVKDPKTGNMVNVYKPSFIFEIPHTNTVLHQQPDTAAPVMIDPSGVTQPPIGGRLRSVGP
jgi:hypothetical protein